MDVVLQTKPLRSITASLDKTIVIHDLANDSPQLVAVLKEHDVELESLIIAPNQRWLVSTDSEGRVLRWDLNSSQIEQSHDDLLSGGARIGAILILPDNQWLFAGDDEGKYSMFKLNRPGSTPIIYFAGEQPATSLIANSNASRILGASADGHIRSWQWSNHELSETTIGIHTAQAVKVVLDSTGTMALSASWDGHAFFWDFTMPGENPKPLSLVGDGKELNTVAFSPDGHWIAAAGKGGKVWLWPTAHCRLSLANQDLVKLPREISTPKNDRPSAKPIT